MPKPIPSPSVKTMYAQMKVVLSFEDCKLIKSLMSGKNRSDYVGRDMGLVSTIRGFEGMERTERILWIINTIINKNCQAAFGVEFLRSTSDSMTEFNGLSYVNLGDPYDCTLIFDHSKGRFYCCSWGDIVEKQSKRFE